MLFLDKEFGEKHTPLSQEAPELGQGVPLSALAENLCRRQSQHWAASHIRQHSSTLGGRQSALSCPPCLTRRSRLLAPSVWIPCFKGNAGPFVGLPSLWVVFAPVSRWMAKWRPLGPKSEKKAKHAFNSCSVSSYRPGIHRLFWLAKAK